MTSLIYLHMWSVEIMMVPRAGSACSQEDLCVNGDTASSQPTLTGW